MKAFPYNSVNEFHSETIALAQHLNLPLNKLRKGIASRYGYQGIKPFEEAIVTASLTQNESLPTYVINKGVVVYVVLYNTFSMGSAGFDWYYKEADAFNAFEIERKAAIEMFPQTNQLVLAKVEVSSHSMATDEIEAEQDVIFDEHPGIRYPLAKNVWIDMVQHHNEVNNHSLKPFIKNIDVANYITDENGVVEEGMGALRTTGMIAAGMAGPDKSLPTLYITFPRGFTEDKMVSAVEITFKDTESFNESKNADSRLSSTGLFLASESSFAIWKEIIDELRQA